MLDGSAAEISGSYFHFLMFFVNTFSVCQKQSPSGVLWKKVFWNISGKHLSRSLFLTKMETVRINFIQQMTPMQLFH